jgi:chromosome segregation ATPase
MDTSFKTCLFGGFDREDVIAYLEKLSREHRDQMTSLETELDAAKKSSAEMEEELLLLRQRVAEQSEELEKRQELDTELERLRKENQDLAQEAEQLRGPAQEYQSLRDHIAEIEISAHRRTEEFRAEAIAKMRGMIEQQREWCEKSRVQYNEMSSRLAGQMQQAQQALSDPDMTGFDQMEQALQSLSDSFDQE